MGNIYNPSGGRPTDVDFEIAVLQKIMGGDQWRSLMLMTAPLKAVVIAGMDVSKEEPFCHRKTVKVLKFSKCWAAGLLRRHHRMCNQTRVGKI